MMNSRGRRLALGWTVLLAAALLAAAASPSAASPSWADHYRRGLDLERAGNWNLALVEFHEAARGERAPRRTIAAPDGTVITGYDPQFHIARCLAETGHFREAVVPLAVAFRAGVTPRPDIEALRRRIEAGLGNPPARKLARAATRVEIQSDPTGAAVFLDDVPVGETPLEVAPIPPGEHRVRVEAPGYEPEEQVITASPGANTVRVALRRIAVAATAAPTPTPQARPTAAPTRPPLPTAATPVVAAVPTALPTSPPTPSFTPVALPPTPTARGRGLLILAVVLAAAFAAWRLARRRRHPPADAAETPTAGPTGATRILPDHTVATQPPQRLGRYLVLETLGRGGMATTYRARRETDGEMVALKVPHEHCLGDGTFVSRFLREGRLGEQLHHPRIVRLFEAGEAGGRPFIAMELLTGHTLKQELRTSGPLTARRAVTLARDIAEALDYAHAKGVIHRDLKPENIMVQGDSLKVMDFGIARLTGQEGLTTASLFIGTPLYAAPEMVEPTTVDHRVDLYALGIILYEMLEGTVPFSADSPYRVLEMHLHAPLPALDALPRPVPPAVWAIVTRLCEKDPAARYPTAEALLVELNRLLNDFTGVERGGDVF